MKSDGVLVWLEGDEDEWDEEIEDSSIKGTLKSVKAVMDSFSPSMNELIEGFENMPDDVDEIEIETSSEVPQHEIDEFVNLYMSHYPKGEEEFKLSIEHLGNNLYKVKCPSTER